MTLGLVKDFLYLTTGQQAPSPPRPNPPAAFCFFFRLCFFGQSDACVCGPSANGVSRRNYEYDTHTHTLRYTPTHGHTHTDRGGGKESTKRRHCVERFDSRVSYGSAKSARNDSGDETPTGPSSRKLGKRNPVTKPVTGGSSRDFQR